MCLFAPPPPPQNLLKEAKQRIPPALMAIEDPMEFNEELAAASGLKGCAYCGGLGHRIADCPKLETRKKDAIAGMRRKDVFGAGGYGGEV